MKEKYKIQYHINSVGTLEPLCVLLDCVEQPCYFEYRKIGGKSPWIFFCGNINLGFSLKEGEAKIFTIHPEVRKKYLKFSSYILEKDFYNEISKFLLLQDTLILSTAFNFVYDYVWYGENVNGELHTDHYFYLIGEDEENYFVVDSPMVLRYPKLICWENNNSIFNIKKINFKEAFQKYCNVVIISYENMLITREEEAVYFKSICEEICKCYSQKNSSSKFMIGRQALLALREEIFKGNESIMQDFFMYHLLVSRRIILQRCFFILQNYLKKEEGLFECLENSINYWMKIKKLAEKRNFENQNVCLLARVEIDQLIVAEDKLIEKMSEIKWLI